VRQAELETYNLLICDLKMQGVDGQMIYQTIATLEVRMRETVRRLSEDWETQSERASEELETHPS